LIFEKAEESILLIGKLLLITLKFTLGETSTPTNMNEVRITTEAAKYLFNRSVNLNSDDFESCL
jgi:hypothetical protein